MTSTSTEQFNFEQETRVASGWILKTAQEFWKRNDPENHRRIPLNLLKERLLRTPEGDTMPNALVIQLLQEADVNDDGFIDYDEYLNFAHAASRIPRARNTFSRATLTLVPRRERSLAKRNRLQKYSCCPPPLFMLLASLVEIAVFIYYKVDMEQSISPIKKPLYSVLVYNPHRRYEAWRFVTYALLHSGYTHILGNLLIQLLLGIALEVIHGWWRVGIIYMAGILFGCLAHSIQTPNQFILGASGGVFAVQFAHLGNLIMNWAEMEMKWLQLILIIIFTITNVAVAIWDTQFNSTPSNASHMGHLGGAIAGVTVGIYILRNFDEKKWEKYVWWAALVLFLILVLVGVILHASLPVPEYFSYDDKTNISEARNYFLKGEWDWLLPPEKPQ